MLQQEVIKELKEAYPDYIEKQDTMLPICLAKINSGTGTKFIIIIDESSETYESLKVYISMNYEGLKDDIVAMLGGGRSRIDVGTFENDMTSFQGKDDVLTLLVHLGYLGYDNEKEEVYIPNEEVRQAFTKAIKKSSWKDVAAAITVSDDLLAATLAKDEEAVARQIDKIHMEKTSVQN